MHVLKIEYPVADYNAWKEAFDRDVLDREGSGVRRYRVLRPTDDPNYVMIDLEFEDASEAEAYLAALQRQFYSSQEESPASSGGPQTRIVEVAEAMGGRVVVSGVVDGDGDRGERNRLDRFEHAGTS